MASGNIPPPALPAPPPSRRSFLGWLLGVGTVGMGAALSVPLLRYVLSPLNRRGARENWTDVGAAASFAGLTLPQACPITLVQVSGWQEVRVEQMVYVLPARNGVHPVLSAICPHLGCSVAWAGTDFHCPCHGGTFSPGGEWVSGPPQRGMDALPSRIQNGRLQVQFRYFRPLIPAKQQVG